MKHEPKWGRLKKKARGVKISRICPFVSLLLHPKGGRVLCVTQMYFLRISSPLGTLVSKLSDFDPFFVFSEVFIGDYDLALSQTMLTQFHL
jgi:hypothetical protein